MAEAGPTLVVVLVLLMSMMYAVDAGRSHRDPRMLRTKLQWVPAVLMPEPSAHACFPPNKTDNMYVAVPPKVFRKGKACNQQIRVSCAEPFGDLGGPWFVCRNGNIHTVTVIDQVAEEMDDDLVYITRKAFGQMAHPEASMIRLLIRS